MTSNESLMNIKAKMLAKTAVTTSMGTPIDKTSMLFQVERPCRA
jgi:hypothetical protein